MIRTLLASLGILASGMAAFSADVQITSRKPVTGTETRIFEGLPLIFFKPALLSSRAELRRLWLKSPPGGFFKAKAPAALPPMMAGGRDIPLDSLFDIIWLHHEHEEPLSPTAQESFAYSNFKYAREMCRPTAAGLPCFATDYDKVMAKTQELYVLCKEYYVTRFVMSLEEHDCRVVF